MSPRIHLLNGPNLNLLGEREPAIYGSHTLADIEALCRNSAAAYGLELVFQQTNAEHEMIGWLQQARHAAGIVINPAAFCLSLGTDSRCTAAVRVSDRRGAHQQYLPARRGLAQHSILAAACTGVITGLGIEGYRLAIEYLAHRIGAGAAAAKR